MQASRYAPLVVVRDDHFHFFISYKLSKSPFYSLNLPDSSSTYYTNIKKQKELVKFLVYTFHPLAEKKDKISLHQLLASLINYC
jgi:hypothetical protein